MSWYQIKVLDADGCIVTQTEESGLAAAKRSAREKLEEPCYSEGVKVEVSNEAGVVIWDRFVVRESCDRSTESSQAAAVVPPDQRLGSATTELMGEEATAIQPTSGPDATSLQGAYYNPDEDHECRAEDIVRTTYGRFYCSVCGVSIE